MRLNRCRGMTLIEMMIGLAVVGILLAGALPSYGVWMQNMQSRSAAESLLSAMQLGRAEAVRRNTDIQVALAGAAWTVTVVRTGEQIQAIGAGESSPTVAVSVMPAGASAVTFNSLGRVSPNTDGSDSIAQVTVSSTALAAADRRELRTDVGLGGTIRMCDLQAPSGDPRGCA